MSTIFDYLIAECPCCNKEFTAQVKGECIFKEYNIESSVSISDAQKLTGNVVLCEECNTKFEIIGDIPSFKIQLQLKEIK